MPKGSKFDYEKEIDDPSPIGYNWNNLKCSCDCLLIFLFFDVMRLFSLVNRLMPVQWE
jgi:hypothetical protein